MIKYYSESTWIVKIYDKCRNGHIYGILVNDARNIDKYAQYYKSELSAADASQSENWNKGLRNNNEDSAAKKVAIQYMGPIKVKFVSYVDSTGVFCNQPSAKIYCQNGGNNCGTSIQDYPKGGNKYGEWNDSTNKDDGWWTINYSGLTSTVDVPYASFNK